MRPLEDVPARQLVSGQVGWVGEAHARVLTEHPLDCIDTEFPHHGHAVTGPDDPPRPRERTPAFFGCYDWHSAVHGAWTLVRSMRLFDHPGQRAIVDKLDARFTPANVEDELDHLRANPEFERPYGWAWFLRLAAELALWDHDEGRRWRETLAPLEGYIVERFETAALDGERPNRTGAHSNSAFALAAAHDYGRVTGNRTLAASVADTAEAWYAEDADYPMGYEPLGQDFLSPALAEADLLRRVLPAGAFADWLAAFLPADPPAPVTVPQSPDGQQLHLVGLNLSRAWCLAGLAAAIEGERAATLREAARAHAERGTARAFTDDYAGAHWLSSFVLYLISRNEGGIAPSRARDP